MILNHWELHYSPPNNEPLKRLDPPRGLWGTNAWYKTFYVPQPALLVTNGRYLIAHSGIHIEGYGVDYPIYAVMQLRLAGPAASEAGLPAYNPEVPTPYLLAHDGINIFGIQDHYANLRPQSQRTLAQGWYRLETYIGAGSDVLDVDGLGYTTKNYELSTHHLDIQLLALP